MKAKKTRKQVRLCFCGKHPEKRSKGKGAGAKNGFLVCPYAPKGTLYVINEAYYKYLCSKCGKAVQSCFCGRVRLST